MESTGAFYLIGIMCTDKSYIISLGMWSRK